MNMFTSVLLLVLWEILLYMKTLFLVVGNGGQDEYVTKILDRNSMESRLKILSHADRKSVV